MNATAIKITIALGLVGSFAHGQCALFRDGAWTAVPCPNGGNCGLEDPETYPWVVIENHNGRSSGADFKTQSAAQTYKAFWSDFNNRRWPAFTGQSEGTYTYEGPLRKCEEMAGKVATDETHRRSPDEWLEQVNRAAQWIRPYLEQAGAKNAAAAAEYIDRVHEAQERVYGIYNVLNKFTDTATDSLNDAFDEIRVGLQEDAGAMYCAGSALVPSMQEFPTLPGQVANYEWTQPLVGGQIAHRLLIAAQGSIVTIAMASQQTTSVGPFHYWEWDTTTGRLSTEWAEGDVIHVSFSGSPRCLSSRDGSKSSATFRSIDNVLCESPEQAKRIAEQLRSSVAK